MIERYPINTPLQEKQKWSDWKSDKGRSLLLEAAAVGNAAFVKYLLANFTFDFLERDENNDTVLDLAIRFD